MTDAAYYRRPLPLIAATVLAAAVAGVAIGYNPLLGLILTFGAIAGVAMVTNPTFALFVLLSTLVLGQLVRVPAFGAEGAILPTDAVLPALFAGWLLRGLLARRLELPGSPLSWPYATMLLVMILTFIIGTSQLPFTTSRQVVGAALYLVRWAEYALLIFVVADVVRRQRTAELVSWALAAVAGVVALLGFIQLRLFPDFSFMVPAGWDPHVGRLLSTWFDPNFLGGWLTLVGLVVGALALYSSGRRRLLWAALAAVLLAALVLTFSRSSYAAFAVGAAALTLLKSRRLFIVLTVAVLLVIAFVPRVQERIRGAVSIDETARLRIESWQNALSVARDYPLTGVGYNAYRYVQVDYGFQPDASEHSAGGSDSSLLTILVTTGPGGLLIYLWIIWASGRLAWQAFRRGRNDLQQALGLGTFAGLASVVVHSMFINSLLFPHTMLTLAVLLGLLVRLRIGEAG